MIARYELKDTSDGQYLFNLKAPNGETILTSERYTSKAGAKNGIEAVRKNSPTESRYDRMVTTSGYPYFALRAENYEVIGASEAYSSRQAMENGIQACKTHGPVAEVVDLTKSVGAFYR